MRSLSNSTAGPPGPLIHSTAILHIPNHSNASTTPHTNPQTQQLATPHYTHSAAITHKPHCFFSVHDDTLLLSPRTKDYVTRAIRGSWADSTLKRYTGTIKQYIKFCDAERVPERLRFPADEFILCAFAASSFGRHAGGTPRSRLSALRAWHIAHNVEWKGSSRLRYVLNGVHNHAPGSSRCPPRPPITATMLSQLVARLDLNSPLDAAVAACATTAFWGQCRLGELLPISSSPLLIATLPTRSDFKRSLKNLDSCILHLPTTKTNRCGEDVVLVDQRFPINPISLLKNHIRINKVQSTTHIFSYSSPTGSLSLTKPSFLRRCNTIWSSLGYPRTTGHCFRIGGTTELLVAGTPPDVVKVMGRWSSGSFLRYWRSLDNIVPLHVRNLRTTRHKRRRR
jgi:hypothetical protein